MCDDFTQDREDAGLAAKGLNRRQFAAMGGVAAIAACAPGEVIAEQDRTASGSITQRDVAIATPDGTMDAFFVHPASGPAPAVIMWPDVAGLRPAYRTMAQRLADDGYAVIAVNPYYRGAKAPVLESFAEWRSDAGQAKIRPLRAALSSEAIMRDATALVGWLDDQDAVDTTRGIGSCGYCMGGPFTVYSAAAVPNRIGAAASFHGGGLVRDDADSPHKLLARATGTDYLFAIAQNDDARAPDDKDALRIAANSAEVDATVEVFAADHGWCTIDSPVYDEAEAERARDMMLAMFAEM